VPSREGFDIVSTHEQIADLEAEIDTLRDAAERGRKIDLVAKAALGLGCALLLAGFLWFSASTLVTGIAAVLGSVALIGSNRGTLGEIGTRIRMVEARRADIIDGLEFRDVAEDFAPPRVQALSGKG
jgi:hypothetical protein